MEQAKVLIVEDDPDARSAAEAALSGAGFRVLLADTLESGRHLFSRHQPELVVLDLHLPDGSGADFCKQIRAHEKLGATPVILLTSSGGLGSKKVGFEAGADQYLVKPVPPEELILWARALLRRMALDSGEGDVLRAGDCELDSKAHSVRWQGVALPRLTVKEFDLLYFLVKRRPRVMSREDILKQVWDTITIDKVVDVHLYNLRKKLPAALADRVQNIPGKGFRFLE